MSRSFNEFIAEAKKSLAVEKPPVEKVPDYHGEKNPYAKTTPSREVKDAKGEDKIAVKSPKVEEIPDFHGKPNPGVKKSSGKGKNIKKDQVVEVASFKDYLEAKMMNQQPKVAINVTDFPQQNAPPSSAGECGKPAPYRAADKPKVSNKALGDQGSTPAYIPKVDPQKDTKEFETLKKTTKGQPQVESKLKNMSLAEVTRYVAEQNRLLTEEGEAGPPDESIPTVTAWTSGKIMPDPLETVEYISHLASVNANLMEMLVRTLKKKQGGMSGLVGKLLDQPESFKELAGHFEGEHGPKHASSMCRAMADGYNDFMSEHINESALSPPIGFDEKPDDELDDDEEPDDDEDQGFEDEEGDEDQGFEDHGEEGSDEPPTELPKKKKKVFSHDNLIDAMSGHKHMLDSMTAHCKKCGTL